MGLSEPVRVAGSRRQGPVGQVCKRLGLEKNEAGIPPHPPPTFKGERKRVFTLSAFGNHPTRPPRSADFNPKP